MLFTDSASSLHLGLDVIVFFFLSHGEDAMMYNETVHTMEIFAC